MPGRPLTTNSVVVDTQVLRGAAVGRPIPARSCWSQGQRFAQPVGEHGVGQRKAVLGVDQVATGQQCVP